MRYVKTEWTHVIHDWSGEEKSLSKKSLSYNCKQKRKNESKWREDPKIQKLKEDDSVSVWVSRQKFLEDNKRSLRSSERDVAKKLSACLEQDGNVDRLSEKQKDWIISICIKVGAYNRRQW